MAGTDRHGQAHGAGTMRRRGVMAAAAAVLAGLAAKGMADRAPVAADDSTWTLPYTGTSSGYNGDVALASFNATGNGVTGVYGSSTGGTGVQGSSTGHAGVVGQSTSDLNGTFTYRVVAKRRDVKGDRLMRVALPKPIDAKLPPMLKP